MSMPTDTKKMARNMSRTGFTRCSMLSPWPDSLTSDPARKAPRATEYPAPSATQAMPKQIPMLATSVVSGRPMLATNRMNRGTTR
jgi:hypothetical protein